MVVRLEDDVLRYLPLHADAKAEGMRCFKSAINCHGILRRWDDGITQHTELTPLKISRRLAYGRSGLNQPLLGCKPRKRLDVADVDYRIGRNGRAPRSDYLIEPVDTDNSSSRWRANRAHRRDLSIG